MVDEKNGKEKKRIIATKVSAKIFGDAQLIDMQIQGEWKKGDIADLLEKALKLYIDLGKGVIEGKELPKQITELIKSASIKAVKEKAKGEKK